MESIGIEAFAFEVIKNGIPIICPETIASITKDAESLTDPPRGRR